jgi:hypothetical protein
MRDHFPGSRITTRQTEELLGEVFRILDFNQTEEGRLPWADASIFDWRIEAQLPYYLIYQHPVHEYMNKGYYTGGKELKDFLAQRINPERGEGSDVWILPMAADWVIGCNHDGCIFYKTMHQPG